MASSSFGLTVTFIGDNSANFGTMSPGEYKKISTNNTNSYTYCNELQVQSDVNNPWQVRIDADPMTHSTRPSVQITSGFRWFATAGLYDTVSWNDFTAGIDKPGFNDFSSERNSLVYTSGKCTPNDNKNDTLGGNTEIQFQYDVVMPSNATAGDYSTTITFTVTQ